MSGVETCEKIAKTTNKSLWFWILPNNPFRCKYPHVISPLFGFALSNHLDSFFNHLTWLDDSLWLWTRCHVIVWLILYIIIIATYYYFMLPPDPWYASRRITASNRLARETYLAVVRYHPNISHQLREEIKPNWNSMWDFVANAVIRGNSKSK